MPELFDFYTSTTHWRMTSAKTSQVYGGNTFTPQSISRSEWERKVGGDEISISMHMHVAPATLFVAGNPAEPLWVDILSVAGTRLFLGRVLSADFDVEKQACKIRVIAFSRAFLGEIPARKYMPTCNANLFDADCGVSSATFLVAVATAGVTFGTLTATHTDFDAKPDGYFTGGYLENGAEKVYITKHVGAVLTLLNNFTSTGNATTTAYPGCDKAKATCVAKFSNVANFRGYDMIPAENPLEGY